MSESEQPQVPVTDSNSEVTLPQNTVPDVPEVSESPQAAPVSVPRAVSRNIVMQGRPADVPPPVSHPTPAVPAPLVVPIDTAEVKESIVQSESVVASSSSPKSDEIKEPITTASPEKTDVSLAQKVLLESPLNRVEPVHEQLTTESEVSQPNTGLDLTTPPPQQPAEPDSPQSRLAAIMNRQIPKLERIFDFYAKLHTPLPRKSSFEALMRNNETLSLSEFIKLGRDFNIVPALMNPQQMKAVFLRCTHAFKEDRQSKPAKSPAVKLESEMDAASRAQTSPSKQNPLVGAATNGNVTNVNAWLTFDEFLIAIQQIGSLCFSNQTDFESPDPAAFLKLLKQMSIPTKSAELFHKLKAIQDHYFGDHRVRPSMFKSTEPQTDVPVRDPVLPIASPRPGGRSTSTASARFPSPPISPRFGPLYSPRAPSAAPKEVPPSSSFSSSTIGSPTPFSAISPTFTPYTPFYMRHTVSSHKQRYPIRKDEANSMLVHDKAVGPVNAVLLYIRDVPFRIPISCFHPFPYCIVWNVLSSQVLQPPPANPKSPRIKPFADNISPKPNSYLVMSIEAQNKREAALASAEAEAEAAAGVRVVKFNRNPVSVRPVVDFIQHGKRFDESNGIPREAVEEEARFFGVFDAMFGKNSVAHKPKSMSPSASSNIRSISTADLGHHTDHFPGRSSSVQFEHHDNEHMYDESLEESAAEQSQGQQDEAPAPAPVPAPIVSPKLSPVRPPSMSLRSPTSHLVLDSPESHQSPFIYSQVRQLSGSERWIVDVRPFEKFIIDCVSTLPDSETPAGTPVRMNIDVSAMRSDRVPSKYHPSNEEGTQGVLVTRSVLLRTDSFVINGVQSPQKGVEPFLTLEGNHCYEFYLASESNLSDVKNTVLIFSRLVVNVGQNHSVASRKLDMSRSAMTEGSSDAVRKSITPVSVDTLSELNRTRNIPFTLPERKKPDEHSDNPSVTSLPPVQAVAAQIPVQPPVQIEKQTSSSNINLPTLNQNATRSQSNAGALQNHPGNSGHIYQPSPPAQQPYQSQLSNPYQANGSHVYQPQPPSFQLPPQQYRVPASPQQMAPQQYQAFPKPLEHRYHEADSQSHMAYQQNQQYPQNQQYQQYQQQQYQPQPHNMQAFAVDPFNANQQYVDPNRPSIQQVLQASQPSQFAMRVQPMFAQNGQPVPLLPRLPSSQYMNVLPTPHLTSLQSVQTPSYEFYYDRPQMMPEANGSLSNQAMGQMQPSQPSGYPAWPQSQYYPQPPMGQMPMGYAPPSHPTHAPYMHDASHSQQWQIEQQIPTTSRQHTPRVGPMDRNTKPTGQSIEVPARARNLK